jgi:hypothetical protein
LYDYFNLNEFFNNKERLKYDQLSKDADYIKKYAELIFKNKKLSLREQERVFAQTRLVLTQFQSNHFVLPSVLFTFIYLKQHDVKLIEQRVFGIQEFVNKIEPLFIGVNSKALNIKYVFSLCIVCYQKYLEEGHDYIKLIDESSDNKKLCFETNFDESSIISSINQIEGVRSEAVSINHLLTKINLTSELVSIV